jgi:hypothetical protein
MIGLLLRHLIRYDFFEGLIFVDSFADNFLCTYLDRIISVIHSLELLTRCFWRSQVARIESRVDGSIEIKRCVSNPVFLLSN